MVGDCEDDYSLHRMTVLKARTLRQLHAILARTRDDRKRRLLTRHLAARGRLMQQQLVKMPLIIADVFGTDRPVFGDLTARVFEINGPVEGSSKTLILARLPVKRGNPPT